MRRQRPAERASLLRTIPLFDRYTDRELGELDTLLDEVEVPAGTVLVRERWWDRQVFIVLSGEAAVSYRGQPLSVLTHGAIFGEKALLGVQPLATTVVSLTPMRLLLIGPKTFATFLEQPRVAGHFLRGVADRLRALSAA